MNHLRNDCFNAARWLTLAWRDGEDFVAKRSGLTQLSGTPTKQKPSWSKKLGFQVDQPDENFVRLYEAVVFQHKWPPTICDLSPEIATSPDVFPSPNPNNLLALSRTDFGYVVAIHDGVIRSWKLLIPDPLTILQIEREGWCSNGDNLVTNLITKGIPFQVLHEVSLKSRSFPNHPGPTLHPTGRDPRLVDYFAYRHDLIDFLSTYPHARAAALCAGGILWRLSVDVLPLPSEAEVIGPFHHNNCISREIDGVTYFTPRLTSQEEQVLVGVYRWAESEQRHRFTFSIVC
jgi:hypothetical protein